ncbi:hypothetical protein BGW36DRAFT_422688 [Talaromyces proteolyticus]|uniref:Uncharacterized protein n=1 Tax=Talaromyces proteolyticus TaxID=1131652 RepID=A0AAD4Q4H8_9EURO|nr:uncharacterized protein BGW36DRAFT_422688 [Talaromyces proteolyticus]KAH8703114.1 hypothetical protein BGW36DRAFT_422688 [Talaromyces proteolyticus]
MAPKFPKFDIVKGLIKWSTGTKTFELIRPNFDKTFIVWELLRVGLQQMPSLDDLIVDGRYDIYGVSLSPLFDVLKDVQSSSLQTLKISDISGTGRAASVEDFKEKEGTSRITTLKLSAFSQTPKVLEGLLRWQKKLEVFSLESYAPFTKNCFVKDVQELESWARALGREAVRKEMSRLGKIQIFLWVRKPSDAEQHIQNRLGALAAELKPYNIEVTVEDTNLPGS